MKKKIYYYALDKTDTTSFWRICGVLPYVRHEDLELVDISHMKEFNWTSFIGVDVLIMQRPFANDHLKLLSAVKVLGIRVILDYDDDLMNVDFHNPTYQQYKDARPTTESCVRLADEVWVSTAGIRDSLLAYNSNIHIIPNAWNDHLFGSEQLSRTGEKKAFWRGGMSHDADVLGVADELVGVINRNEDWIFGFQGSRFTGMELKCGDNYHVINGVGIMEYFRFIRGERPSVMFYPLAETMFNRAKSNICWMEASWCGASFFGTKALPEFDLPFIRDFSELENGLRDMKDTATESWCYIQENLLLSDINKKRIERLLWGTYQD